MRLAKELAWLAKAMALYTSEEDDYTARLPPASSKFKAGRQHLSKQESQ